MRTIGFLVASACLAAEVSAFLPPTPFVTRGPLVRARGQSVLMAASVDEYKAAYEDLKEMIDKANCAPIMVRFAWHDSGTFNKENADKPFPERGGADGSIRFEPELKHGANAGLGVALKLLEPIKKKHASVGWADLIQAASAAAIEVTGGPKIPLRYGRVDAQGPDDCPQEGNLPGANRAGEQKAPFSDGTKTPADHLRKVFHRMGLSDKDIVALSGAHTLGRAYKDRSGLGDEQTKYTTGEHVARKDGKSGYGRKGGQPWTERWLKFDNSYFSTVYDPNADPELLKLDTDLCLFGDEGFRPFAVKYAEDQDAFFQDYIESHLKLSELGSEWEEGKPIEV